MAYKELKDTDYATLQRDLIAEKGSPFQREFLEKLKDSKDFIKWFHEKVEIEEGQDEISNHLSDQLSEHEFKEPPKQAEEMLFEKWGSIITPAQACRSSFWGYVTLRHIEEGKIESHYLAANGGTHPGGLERIDKALNGDDVVKIDDAVRTALRRLSGLQRERGHRTVYVDCPFGRAWWRCYIAKTVCSEIPTANSEKVMEVFRINQSYWEVLIDSIVSKSSVFGGTNIRSALIWTISEKINGKKSSLSDYKHLRIIIKKIGVRLAWQELAIFSPEELRQLFENEFLA